jgi:hypothetical protein
VVDYREVTEETIESDRIRSVEGRGMQGINFIGSALEALGIPACEDHLGAFRTCTACRFESDTRATANHHNGLPKELRFAVERRSYSAHFMATLFYAPAIILQSHVTWPPKLAPPLSGNYLSNFKRPLCAPNLFFNAEIGQNLIAFHLTHAHNDISSVLTLMRNVAKRKSVSSQLHIGLLRVKFSTVSGL